MKQEVKDSERNVIDHIDNRIDDLIEHLTAITQHLSGELMKQTTAESEMRDAEQSMETRRAQQQAENEARQEYLEAPGDCVTATGMTGTMTGAKVAAEMRRNLGRAEGDRQRNGTADTNGSETKSSFAMLKRQYGDYCGKADAAMELCELAEDERMQDAHVRAETLLDAQHGTLDQDILLAAQDMCANSTRAVPPSRMSKDEIISASGVTTQTSRNEVDAKISWASAACFDMIRTQTPSMEMKSWATGVSGDPDYINPNYDGDGISIYDQIRTEVERRMDVAWYTTRVSGSNDSTKLQELVTMGALGLFLDWQRYQLERVNAMNLAGMNATLAQQHYNNETAPNGGL
ncbi:MAG: hypothetical protein Alpg2KO_31400 [Alphaproteobacteria bacterium]